MSRSLLLFLLCTPSVSAAWIVTTNETKETLVIQTFETVNGNRVAAKPVKVAAGETLRQFQAGPTTLTVQIQDPGKWKLLTTTDITLKGNDLIFIIKSVAGQIKLVEAKK